MSKKAKSSNRSISVRYVVFIQTLVITLLVFLIPFLIAQNSMQSSNNLSLETAKGIGSTLGAKIQLLSGSNVINEVQTFIEKFDNILLEFERTFISTNTSFSDFDVMYNVLLNLQTSTLAPIPYIYYGTESGIFFGMGTHTGGPLDSNLTILYVFNENEVPFGCQLCPNTPGHNSTQLVESYIGLNGLPNSTIRSISNGYIMKQRPWYVQALDAVQNFSVSSKSLWTDIYSFPEELNAVGIAISRPIKNLDGSLNGVIAADVIFDSLTYSLRSSKTLNGFAYVMNATGTLIGSSSDEPVYDINTRVPMKASQMNDTLIKTTGIYLEKLMINLNLSDFRSFGINGSQRFVIDDLLFQIEQIPNQIPILLVVNGAPKKDYLEDLDEVQFNLRRELVTNASQITIIAVAVFVILVSFSIIGTCLWIVRPLQQMITIMDQATRFDFTVLKNQDIIAKRSVLTEFASLQTSTIAMIKNFAQAINAFNELSTYRGGELDVSSNNYDVD
ncbi:hypothetical protein HK099_006321 [Clydaea vesicula]|uniref:Cache domain-containing protein n=1 Tax=Clydaea vesicula TaxID=447962 RepID=A0AAD5U0E9_9FUNG|nr:hypothetical protein HK099_006321 [Clydaea vesicula]KAJ3379711.1 hypothetical protein HDU92_006516 [Lobulomyces angularis]